MDVRIIRQFSVILMSAFAPTVWKTQSRGDDVADGCFFLTAYLYAQQYITRLYFYLLDVDLCSGRSISFEDILYMPIRFFFKLNFLFGLWVSGNGIK